ncbi:hypothetical protein EC991_010096 [Linnemannia zychae]|nr:hypothetical protein EC991_010096 [Linnemannia zychae]
MSHSPSNNATTTSSPPSPSANTPITAAAPMPQAPSRMTEHQMNINIERNHRTLPPQFHSSSPSKYPSIPRFTPAIPSRMGGNYTPNTHGSGNSNNGGSGSYTHNSSGYNHRIGTSSASSSPPGTPPSGLRNYYLNAAYQRSQHHLYSKGSSAIPGSASQHQYQQQRPPMSTGSHHHQQQYGARVQVPEPAVARRSYSADHLRVPETDLATGGILQSTENHVMTLQRALSKLIEKNEQSDNEDEENQATATTTGGENTPTNKTGSNTSSSPSTPPGTPPHRKGLTKYPKVEMDRLDYEKVTAITSFSAESDITLAPPQNPTDGNATAEISEKERLELEKTKKKTGRVSIFLQKDGLDMSLPATTPVATDLRRQPSKAGVLSNLLKLQGIGRQQKQHRASKVKTTKEKKKRPTMYSRSANASTASLTTKSVFSTYPPLPVTPSQQQQGSTSLSIFKPTPRNNGNNSGINSNRHSTHFDNVFAQSFSVMNSPFQSPNISPRGSFSGGENTPNGFYFTPGTSGTASPNGGQYGAPLSNEEKLQITIAVADILERQDFILRLAKSLIKYGAPSHRLEDAVDHAAKTLEINLQCIYLPNVMIVSFTDYETHTSETHLLKVPAGLDMYKCALVHQVQKMVTHSAMPVEEAIMKLDTINTEKDANGRWVTVLAYAVAGFCTAPMFFKGNWIDAIISFFMGAAVGLLVWLSEKVPSYAHICDITMSVVVAFVAEALRHHNVCTSAIKFAGIVIILPGYTITCSILELSSRHIISGSVRLFYAIVFSLLLGYGLTIGASLWSLFDHSTRDDGSKFSAECPNAPLNPLWNILFVPFFAISLNIWLKAHPRQWPLATVLSIVGYSVSYTSSVYGGAKTEVSSALAAFAIGLCGNVYQRVTRQLTFQAVVCAVFFLVPGSIGLKGAMAWFTEDMSGGVNFALQMVVTAIAISVGLFTSALVIYPMGKTRSAQMTF